MKKERIKYECECCHNWFKHSSMSTHHIWPKCWYHHQGPRVELCLDCHCEFERQNPHSHIWTKQEAEQRWATFCQEHNQDNQRRYQMGRRMSEEELAKGGWERKEDFNGSQVWVDTFQMIIIDPKNSEIVYHCVTKQVLDHSKAGH